jgi:putative phage-type endonuclease
MVTKVSTTKMSREEWLQRRSNTIGGSDAAALLGLNNYASPYSLWCEKTGKVVPEDISDKEAVRLGNDLEDYVAKRWMEATGKKVRKDNHMIYNDQYPFAHANIDRAVVGENAGLECKTTSSWEILQQCRDGQFPATWYAQMTHYMMITGAEKWYLGVLVLGKGFYDFEITRDEAEIEALANAEREFWDYVTNNVAPPLDGTEATQGALKTILADSSPGQAVDLTGVSMHLSLYMTLKEKIKELESELSEHQAHIMQYMGTAEKGTFDNSTVSFKTQTRQIFDRKAFEADNGAIPEIYFNTSTSRPFKVTTRKR